METRTNKYSDNDSTTTMSRAKKNQNLYQEINELQMDSFDVNSNTEVLGNNGRTIDIEKLRDMLDKKYREEEKNKTLAKSYIDENKERIKLDETREYDINAILSKAKEEKQTDDYEIERLKKLRNTQVNILSELNIDSLKEVEHKAVSDAEKDKLKELIDTINITEATNKIKKQDMDPLDLLSDLKGDEDETKVEGVKELTEEIQRQVEDEEAKQSLDELHEELTKDLKEELATDTNKIDNLTTELKGVLEKDNKSKDKEESREENSFYTTSSLIKQDDFDDFSDLRKDLSATNIVVKILIVVVVLALVCGVIFLLNRILDWGLF